MLLRSILLFLYSVSSWAQSASSPGIATEWEARKQIDELKTQLAKVPAQLDQLNPKAWQAAGAPGAYLDELEGSRKQLRSLGQALDELRQTPEKLAVALEIYLRLNATDESLRVVVEAVRKYESAAVADQLEAKLGETGAAKEKFRVYLLDLAGERDRQLDVMQKEAQRCRTEANLPVTGKPAVPKSVKAPAVVKVPAVVKEKK